MAAWEHAGAVSIGTGRATAQAPTMVLSTPRTGAIRDLRAALGAPYGAQLCDALAVPQPLLNVDIFIELLRRQQLQDVAPDDLLRAVAEQAFGSQVPCGDDTAQLPEITASVDASMSAASMPAA